MDDHSLGTAVRRRAVRVVFGVALSFWMPPVKQAWAQFQIVESPDDDADSETGAVAPEPPVPGASAIPGRRPAANDEAQELIEPVEESAEEAAKLHPAEANEPAQLPPRNPPPRTHKRGAQALEGPVQNGGPVTQPFKPIPNRKRTKTPSVGAEVSGPRALLQQAYRKSKSTKSADDCTKMIGLCMTAVESHTLSPASLKYAHQLLAFAHNLRGEYLAAEGKNVAAVADFDQALRYDPKRWKAIHNRGICHGMEGDDEQALADFGETIRLKPNYANAYYNRGEIYYDRGEFDKAIADYNQAVRYAPQDSEAYNSRGHAYYRMGDYDRAIRDYQKAIDQSPDNAAAYTNRGDAYSDLGRWAEAAADFKTALRIDPQLGRAFQSAAWLMATCPDERFRHPEFALTAAQKAIEIDGRDFRSLDCLAAAHASAGDFDRAKEAAAEALELAPTELHAMYVARLNRYEQSQPFRQAIAQTQPGSEVQQASASEPITDEPPTAANPASSPRTTSQPAGPSTVIDVRVEGNTVTQVQRIRPHVTTHAGKPLDRQKVAEDVRRLKATGMFSDVRAAYRQTAEGVVVVYHVTEREQ